MSTPSETTTRQAGPVTFAAGGAAAVTTLIVGVLDRVGVPLTTLEQGAVTVCIIMIAGWAVRSRAENTARGRYEA